MIVDIDREIVLDGSVESRGRGRPRRGEGYGERLDIRIGPDEQAALQHMLIESDRTKSEIVRSAILMYYHAAWGRW